MSEAATHIHDADRKRLADWLGNYAAQTARCAGELAQYTAAAHRDPEAAMRLAIYSAGELEKIAARIRRLALADPAP